MSLETNLLGEYVRIPEHNDGKDAYGFVRVVWMDEDTGNLYLYVCIDGELFNVNYGEVEIVQ